MTTVTTTKPLAAIRVLDLSRLLPGPFCTQLLVDLGAEVLKIEDTQGGDYIRYTPPLLADGNSVYFHALNRGKKSVALDLKSAADRDKFFALLATADVVVESFRPGVMAKLGIAPATLLEKNPRVVVCSISGYSQTGPYAQKAGHDINYLARAGALALMKRPGLLPVQAADIAGAALPAAFSICAALVGRAATGKGAILDVSMTHQAHGLLAMTLSRASVPGEGPLGAGRELLVGRVPCYDVYPTADGWISLGALEPKFWKGFCEAVDAPELLDRGFDEGEHGDDVRDRLARILTKRTNAEWHAHFAPRDVCVEVVRTPEEALADETFQRVTIKVGANNEDVTLPIPAIAFPGVAPSSTRGPALGEHTEAVLAALGK